MIATLFPTSKVSTQTGHARHFFQNNLICSYHLIPMKSDDIPKMAVITPFGLREFLHMPFGFKNTAQSFLRPMANILQETSFISVYLGDILVASKSAVEHTGHLREVFQLFSANESQE